MFSVLLVEDEKMELETLQNYVNWESCGIDRVYTARGAKSALECIHANEPDIMITDIQMPGMSGIELAKQAVEEGYNCKVVFLTGYDRFDYAKDAISLHAEGYLLKPFQVQEVEAMVKDLVSKLEGEQKENRVKKLAADRVIDQACHGTLADPQEAAMNYFHLPAEQPAFWILAIFGLDEKQRMQVREYWHMAHGLWMEPFLLLIFAKEIQAADLSKQIMEYFPKTKLQFVYAQKPASLIGLREAALQIHACREDLFYEAAGKIMKDSDRKVRKVYANRVDSMGEKGDLVQAILTGDTAEACLQLDACLQQLTDLQQEACCQNAFSLFLYLHNTMEKKGDMDDQANIPNLLHAENFETLRSNFRSYVIQCCDFCRMISETRLSYYVKRYVSVHYMEPCTVEEMAAGINLSPNYLRKKFKEETEMTILEYVTEERMNRAGEMLKDPGRKVKEIAVAVGYENISYFTQLFSRKYGVTPNEYRKIHS